MICEPCPEKPPRPSLDLTGQRYGRWIVLRFYGRSADRVYLWWCHCDCGNERAVQSQSLRAGKSQSCGCLAFEITRDRETTHGGCGTRTYSIWCGMLTRCSNENRADYKDYGGRGIQVCDRWLDFANFRDDMGEAPKGMTIDRIKNDLGYSPENCRWATFAEQARNRRSNHLVTLGDETLPLIVWIERRQMSRHTVDARVAHGWSIERALLQPIRKRKQI